MKRILYILATALSLLACRGRPLQIIKEERPQVNLGRSSFIICGKSGIQTHGTVEPYAGFRVRSIRSLWHLSLTVDALVVTRTMQR